MKKTLSILIITIISIQFLSAQRGEGYEKRKEQFKAQHISFITNKLDLSTAEAEKFWPLFNEYSKKKDDITSKRRKSMRLIMHNNGDLTNEEAEIIADMYIKTTQAETNLAVEYHEKFKKVLPIQKVAKLYQAEKLFKRELLNNLKKGHGQKGN